VYSLYVHPEAQGHSIGARLLAEAVASFEAEGLRRATLWVFEANAAARGFYARSGWEPTHDRRVEPEFGEPEIQLMRTVGGSNRSPDHRASAGWRQEAGPRS
jgi:RimJ/RimL family protein N-acetyltransferase